MIELHSCSYYCERPDCIKTQRDEMRDNLACDAVAWCYIHEGECEEIGWGLPPDAVKNEATLLYAAPQSALEQPAEMVLVPREPDTTHMENYQAGLWSRRNLEALLEDVAAAQKLGMQAMDENAALRENLDALLQKQMDITLKEYKRAEKAEAENAALRGLLERAKWMELYGEIVAEKNK